MVQMLEVPRVSSLGNGEDFAGVVIVESDWFYLLTDLHLQGFMAWKGKLQGGLVCVEKRV